jgi:hypothetical protein
MRLFPAQPPPNRLQISVRSCEFHTNTDALLRHALWRHRSAFPLNASYVEQGIAADVKELALTHISEKPTFGPHGLRRNSLPVTSHRDAFLLQPLKRCAAHNGVRSRAAHGITPFHEDRAGCVLALAFKSVRNSSVRGGKRDLSPVSGLQAVRCQGGSSCKPVWSASSRVWLPLRADRRSSNWRVGTP